MGLGDMRTPVTSSDGDDGQFGDNDSSANGSCDFLGTFDTETDVTILV